MRETRPAGATASTSATSCAGTSRPRADDPEFEQWHVMHERLAASPGSAAWFMRALMETDIREVLPTISVPTMIMFNARWREGCIYMAERIPNAKLVELTAPDLSIYGDAQVPVAVERFLAEGHVDLAPERVLTTVLFTDIVDSTSRAAEMGDAAWRSLLEAHHATVGTARPSRRQPRPQHGRRRLCDVFDGPARAITCAHGIRRAVRDLGLDIRAGIHTGEVEFVRGRVEGIAVHIGARIAAEASRARCSSRASCATLRAAPESSSRARRPRAEGCPR